MEVSNLVSIQYRISIRVDTSYINNFSVNFWQPNLHAIKKYHVRYTLSSLGSANNKITPLRYNHESHQNHKKCLT